MAGRSTLLLSVLFAAACVHTTAESFIYSHGLAAAAGLDARDLTSDLGPALPAEERALSVAAGRKLYRTHCARCHGASGRGDGLDAAGPARRPADLVVAAERYNERQIYFLVARGQPGMPTWREVLSEDELTQIARYVGSLKIPTRQGR